MDDYNIINGITVGYPEILLLVITALTIVGCHNYLLWKNKKDMGRMLLAVLFMSVTTAVFMQPKVPKCLR